MHSSSDPRCVFLEFRQKVTDRREASYDAYSDSFKEKDKSNTSPVAGSRYKYLSVRLQPFA